jgi:hypothetical protein
MSQSFIQANVRLIVIGNSHWTCGEQTECIIEKKKTWQTVQRVRIDEQVSKTDRQDEVHKFTNSCLQYRSNNLNNLSSSLQVNSTMTRCLQYTSRQRYTAADIWPCLPRAPTWRFFNQTDYHSKAHPSLPPTKTIAARRCHDPQQRLKYRGQSVKRDSLARL